MQTGNRCGTNFREPGIGMVGMRRDLQEHLCEIAIEVKEIYRLLKTLLYINVIVVNCSLILFRKLVEGISGGRQAGTEETD